MERGNYPKKEKKKPKNQDRDFLSEEKTKTILTNKSICPVCGQKVDLTKQQSLSKDCVVVPWFATYEGILLAIEEGLGQDPHSDRKRIHWACDLCLHTGKAIIGDSKEQKFCDCYPYFAYYDEERECQECGKKYVFEKTEQRYWYETLKFWVQSRPKYCKECYKKKHPEQKNKQNDNGPS